VKGSVVTLPRCINGLTKLYIHTVYRRRFRASIRSAGLTAQSRNVRVCWPGTHEVLRAVGDLDSSVVPLFLLRAHLYLLQSVPLGQRAGRPRRADSNRADGFRRKPWQWRDHLIGVRGSAACANNSVCPARLTRRARSGHRPATNQAADLHGQRVRANCFGLLNPRRSSYPVGRGGWLRRGAGAICACH